jgi:hypothetical protein
LYTHGNEDFYADNVEIPICEQLGNEGLHAPGRASVTHSKKQVYRGVVVAPTRASVTNANRSVHTGGALVQKRKEIVILGMTQGTWPSDKKEDSER